MGLFYKEMMFASLYMSQVKARVEPLWQAQGVLQRIEAEVTRRRGGEQPGFTGGRSSPATPTTPVDAPLARGLDGRWGLAPALVAPPAPRADAPPGEAAALGTAPEPRPPAGVVPGLEAMAGFPVCAGPVEGRAHELAVPHPAEPPVREDADAGREQAAAGAMRGRRESRAGRLARRLAWAIRNPELAADAIAPTVMAENFHR